MADPAEYLSKATDIAMKMTAVLLAGVALYEALNSLNPKPATDDQLQLNWDSEAADGTQ
jgi:hypothetical protein